MIREALKKRETEENRSNFFQLRFFTNLFQRIRCNCKPRTQSYALLNREATQSEEFLIPMTEPSRRIRNPGDWSDGSETSLTSYLETRSNSAVTSDHIGIDMPDFQIEEDEDYNPHRRSMRRRTRNDADNYQGFLKSSTICKISLLSWMKSFAITTILLALTSCLVIISNQDYIEAVSNWISVQGPMAYILSAFVLLVVIFSSFGYLGCLCISCLNRYIFRR